MIGSNMISTSQRSCSMFLLLRHLTMVLHCNRERFWLSVHKVNLPSFCSVVSCFLSCFYEIKVSLRLVLYEALILEFEWIAFGSDRAAQGSSCGGGLGHGSFGEIIQSDVEGASC